MAWVAKPSATMKIARRPEPYLTPALREQLERDVLPRYETRHGALLPVLHAVQHEAGWLPPQALDEVADFLGLTAAQVLDTASFYEEFWLHPKGRHVVAVCRSIACEFCGQPEITKACKQKLGIELGETTRDGEFTLIERECLGACGGAPAILVDETLHENVTVDQIPRLLDEAGKHGGH